VTPRVVLVTDPLYSLEHTSRVIRWAAAALGPGRLLVQLRDKTSGEAELLERARKLREVTQEAQAGFVVNGSVAVAEAARADGVHLPSVASLAGARARLGEGAFLTTAAHGDDDLRAAMAAGANAALVSPIFTTPGKGQARGVAAIASARAIVDASRRAPALLVYALGGVTPGNAAVCYEAGADGVAVIRALCEPASEGAIRAVAQALAQATPVAGRRDEC
jgi:thiamine-phosphate pyrophosphorylase